VAQLHLVQPSICLRNLQICVWMLDQQVLSLINNNNRAFQLLRIAALKINIATVFLHIINPMLILPQELTQLKLLKEPHQYQVREIAYQIKIICTVQDKQLLRLLKDH
jgi:hypothetical protein